jgi:cyanobactin maturation PatA/PatG family protease
MAILDAPVDRANPCLESAKLEQRWLGHHGHCSPHGTEVASVIFAGHNTSVLGVAPRCRGVSIPIYDCEPDLSPSTNQHQLAIAIREALAAGAHVINVSAGQLVSAATAEPELSEAVRACADAGVLIVAAAGNDGCDCLHVPAALPCVLAVGATRWDGSPLPGSNWGSIYGKQGILAPGENIPVAGTHGGAQFRTGTSYATAIVSGVVALLLSRQRRHGRPIRPLLIRDALLTAAVESNRQSSPDSRLLAGRLNIPRAMHLLDHWSTTMTEEMNLDLTTGCNSQPENGPARPAALSPSSEYAVPLPQTSLAPEPPALELRSREFNGAVEPSACSSCRGERQLVYALGRLNYDFGSEAGLDAFKQRMRHLSHPWVEGDGVLWRDANPLDERHLLKFFDILSDGKISEPWVPALNWTLEVGGLPLYAIRPEGPFALAGYEMLMGYFIEQFPVKKKKGDTDEQGEKQKKKKKKKEVAVSECVAVPGVISGQAALFSGLRVPVITPDLRGLRNWSRDALVEAVLNADDEEEDEDDNDNGDDECNVVELKKSLKEFLDRLYFELQNSGRTSQERALNYAGTNLAQPTKIFVEEFKAKRALDSIGVERSTICRPGSDCWDIKLAFFDPNLPMQTVRSLHRYTVDVSEVIPVTVGETRSWKAR